MNSMEVRVLVAAEIDLKMGKYFYNDIEQGVGNYFWDSLLSDIESLVIYSGIHKKEFGLHRMLAKRFPYFIYYFVKDDISFVAAVLPMRKNPKWIEIELTERRGSN